MIEIRPAVPEDAPGMARVIVDTWYAAHAGQVTAERLAQRRATWGYDESEQAWRRAIAEADGGAGLVLVATENGQVVAVAASEVTETGDAEVGALYVDTPRQRSGIGRRLIAMVIDHYRNHGVPRLSIAVLAANQPARQFYERMGGTESGTREDPDGLQVVYTWDLNNPVLQPACSPDGEFVFVCYAHADRDEVYRQVAWLQTQGLRVWYDEGLTAGSVWRTEVAQALEKASRVLFFASENSLASDHCNRELNFALDTGIDILPVYIEEVTLTPDLRMGLSRVQALYPGRLEESLFREKLIHGLTRNRRTLALSPPSGRRRRKPAWFVSAAVCLAAIVGVIIWWLPPRETVEETPILQIHSFEDLSVESSLGWVSGGMSDALTFYLTLVDGLIVRTAPVPVKPSPGAGNNSLMLTGSVQQDGDTVLVTARLSRQADGELLWSATYQESLVDLFEIQRKIAWEIMEAIEASIGQSVSPRWEIVMTESRYGAADVRAYENYMKALEIKLAPSPTPEDLVSALALNRKAVEIDPNYSMGFVGLGGTYQRFWYLYRKPQDRQAAVEAFDRAIALDTSNPIAIGNRVTMATEDRQWRHSIALVEGADHWTDVLDVARAATAYLVALINAGEWDQAQARLDELMLFVQRNPVRFPPESPIHVEIGMAMSMLRRPAQAIIEHLEPMLPFQTTWKSVVNSLLSDAYFAEGLEDAGLKHLYRSLPQERAEAARAAYENGGRMEIYRTLLDLDQANGQPCRQGNARWLAILGERERMLSCVNEIRPRILDLRWTTSQFDPYRSDPEFVAALDAREITVHEGCCSVVP